MIVKEIFLGTEERCVAALKYILSLPDEKLCVHPPYRRQHHKSNHGEDQSRETIMQTLAQIFRAARIGWELYRATFTAHYAETFTRIRRRIHTRANNGQKGSKSTIHAHG